jgi:hypothetical protein
MMNLIEKILAAFAWLQIFISPFLIGAILSVITWLGLNNIWGHILAISLAIAGIFAGIKLAESARKNKGAIEFMSRISATPELDKKENSEKSTEVGK